MMPREVLVEGMGVGQDDPGRPLDPPPPPGRGVPVVGVRPKIDSASRLDCTKLFELVVGERFQRIDVNGAGVLVLKEGLQDGDVER